MKQRKLPTWLQHGWQKRLEAIAVVTALVVTGTCPQMTVHAEEVKAERVEEKQQEESVETTTQVGTVQKEKAEFSVMDIAEVEVSSPVGLVLDSSSEGVLTVVYGPSSTKEVEKYRIYVDGEVINDQATVALYTFENISAGEHLVQVTAVLADGTESEKSGCEGRIVVKGEATTDTPESKYEGVIAISEARDVITVGETVTLSFYENDDFASAIQMVTVNGNEVDFEKRNNGLAISGKYFDAVGVYHIEVEANGYETSDVYQQVFEQDCWELIFADEFNGNKLDTNIWSYQNGTGAEYGLNGWGNDEEQYYMDDNISVSEGTLTIEAKKESVDSKNYTSGRIRSLQENNEGFSTTYGRFEAKIKLPAGEGIWPAFWMLPSTDVYGTWAANGEIDIMEARGRLTNQVLGTIHYGEVWPNNKSAGATYELPDGGSITDYHLYALEWDVDTMIWYVDGVETYRTSNWYSKGEGNAANYAYPAPFDEAFHIVLNMAVGGTFDGGRRPADSIFDHPVTMDVDYVRVYRNNTEGYYDREVSAPEQESDEELYAKFSKEYADKDGNFVTDTTYETVEKAAGVVSTDIKNNWSRHWYYLLGDFGATANYNKSIIDGKSYAVLDITNGGNQNYAVQLVQHLPLVKGYTYEVSFDAFASKDRSMIVKFAGDDDNGWGAYSNAFESSLTTEAQKYSYRFTMTGETDETARLEFNAGLDTGKVSIANVCVKVVDSAEEETEEKEPLENGNHIYNGTFDQGTGKLAYWKLDEAAIEADSKVTDKHLLLQAGEISQNGLQLLGKDTYELTWKAKGDNQVLSVFLTDKTGEMVYASENYTLTKDMVTYALQFVMPTLVTDTKAVLHMQTADSVLLDDVMLLRLTDNNVSYDDIKIYPLSNGDFSEELVGWSEYTDGGAGCATALSVEKQDGNTVAVVHGAKGAQPYFNMLIHEDVAVKKGKQYELIFRAKASSEQNLEIKLENASYTSTLAENFKVGTAWKDYKFSFKSGLEGETALKFLLAGVNEVTTIYFDDVILKVAGVDLKEAPVLTSVGAVKQGQSVVLQYNENTDWEQSLMRILVAGKEIDEACFTVETDKNIVTIAAEVFENAKQYAIKIIAQGYDYTLASQIITENAKVDGSNVAPDFEQWTHYVGSDWAYVNSTITSRTQHDVTLTVKAGGGWADTAWGVQLVKEQIPVVTGYPYEVSFTADAQQNKRIAVKMEDAQGQELFYQEYALQAGEEQQISILTKEMPTEFVKVYFALGVFADEQNIDTTICIKDFTIVNANADVEKPETDKPEDDETSEVKPEEPKKEESKQESTNQSSVEPKKETTVIKEEKVALTMVPKFIETTDAYQIPLLGTDGKISVKEMLQLNRRAKTMEAYLSNTMAITMDMEQLTAKVADMDLGVYQTRELNYGQGFESVTVVPRTETVLGVKVSIHINVGKEHAGKTAYVFAKSLQTNEFECVQTAVINEIGNVAYTTDEYRTLVVLYK